METGKSPERIPADISILQKNQTEKEHQRDLVSEVLRKLLCTIYQVDRSVPVSRIIAFDRIRPSWPLTNSRFQKRLSELAPPLLLRKEVIQPQVPLRLPCYDFIPITSLTLGRCLTRLAHALRAKPAFMM